MKKTSLIIAAALVLGIAGAAHANSILPAIDSAKTNGGSIMKHWVEIDDGIWTAVKGMRERRQIRFVRLIQSWSPDQQEVAFNEGWPLYRWREDFAGRVTEIWSYPDSDLQYIFDVDGKLIETRVQ